MDITGLPGKWRREAAGLASGDLHASRRATLEQCADEQELAYHQHAHDSEFHGGCRFCDWEREHNDNYPEPAR